MEAINLAVGSILRNKLRSFLTMLGIVIGVMSVIVLIAMVSGLQSYITKQFTDLGSNLMFVYPGKIGESAGPPGRPQVNRLKTEHAHSLKAGLRGEAEVSAAIQKISTLKYKNKSTKNTTVMGAEGNIREVIKYFNLDEGRFFKPSEADAGKRLVVIGHGVKNTLFGTKNPIGEQVQIDKLKYTVIGVMKERGATMGADQDNMAVIPLSAAMGQFGFENINAIYITTLSAESVADVQAKANKILNKFLSEDDFTVMTAEQTLSTITQITDVLKIALGGIAAISLIVGGIGVMNIMLVSVTERTREIGLRKALGAKATDIRNQFLIEALTLSGSGGIIGIVIGIIISYIAGNFITTTVPLWSVLLSFGFSMLVGVVFGVAPAIRAARLNPIQALRYE